MKLLIGLLVAGVCFAQEAGQAQLAHFHHVHLNVTDPAAAIAFYTSTFDCEKAGFAGMQEAVWAQKSWLLFARAQPVAVEGISYTEARDVRVEPRQGYS